MARVQPTMPREGLVAALTSRYAVNRWTVDGLRAASAQEFLSTLRTRKTILESRGVAVEGLASLIRNLERYEGQSVHVLAGVARDGNLTACANAGFTELLGAFVLPAAAATVRA